MQASQNQENQADFNFENAYARIEKILEELNSGQVSLDRSLLLYEEADALISKCATRLNQAEQRIAILMKKRNGDLATDSQGNPLSEEWTPQAQTPNLPKDQMP